MFSRKDLQISVVRFPSVIFIDCAKYSIIRQSVSVRYNCFEFSLARDGAGNYNLWISEGDVKRIVSISLGSSTRNKSSNTVFLGQQFLVERIGTDGSVTRAIELIKKLDGKVDCFGLGGMDHYLYAAGRKYAMREVSHIVRSARQTPTVDGGGLKMTLEPRVLHQLDEGGLVPLRGKRIFLVSGTDRYGMATAIAELTTTVVYGDMIFALGLPLPLRSLKALDRMGTLLLPIICQLPMSVLYPTGEKQKETSLKYARFFEWAEVICGDFLYIRRYLPPGMEGRTVITNTTRTADVQLLKERGIKCLVTTTAQIGGESFGQNVMEAVLVVLSGKQPEELTKDDYSALINKLGWRAQVINL